jgi:PAS domain S-box-containing protein
VIELEYSYKERSLRKKMKTPLEQFPETNPNPLLNVSNDCTVLSSNEAQEEANLDLVDLLDTKAIQSLMDDFYKLAHIPMSLDDLKGKVLVGIGWQDICTKFHRVNPKSCKHCIESDTELSAGVSHGELKLYKCKNNMWDMVTPVIVGGQHLGNIFSGQFFFEDEPLDYELFRSQAKKYGFNEEEYIAALEKVPRLSREAVNLGMAFLAKFANMLSQISHSNLKLTHSLAERNTILNTLQESEKRERARSEELEALLYAVPAAVCIAHDPRAFQITGNRLSYEWIRIPEGANESKSVPEGEKLQTFSIFKDGMEIPPAGMPMQVSAAGIELQDYEFALAYPDGETRYLLGNARPLCDEHGKPRGSISAFIDITEHKKAEKALKEANETLEKKVQERTLELERAYSSLKESEEKYRNIVETANEGIIITNPECRIIFFNNKFAEMLFCTPDKLINRSAWDVISDDYKHIVKMNLKMWKQGINNSFEVKLIREDGSFLWVFLSAKALFDEYGKYDGSIVMLTDLTKKKEAEEALNTVEISRKKEIHHRIKNNLQVISSLLDLQVEKFKGKKNIKDSEVVEAFRESQDRVVSMALIHEELYKGKNTDTINISSYIKNLTDNLFLSYRRENIDISLGIDIEENLFFDMDISVPLGIVVNELVSNSFKHAFFGREKGEIGVKLHRENNVKCENQEYGTIFNLVVSDNGIGFPEEFDIEDLDTLGMQLVVSLVEQLDGELDMKRDDGTEFVIRFTINEMKNYVSIKHLRLFDND